MSKQYELTGAKTYATLKSLFKAGETYTEDQVGTALGATTESGDSMFTEIDPAAEAGLGEKTEAPSKKLVIGSKGKQPNKQANGESDSAEGQDDSTLTV